MSDWSQALQLVALYPLFSLERTFGFDFFQAAVLLQVSACSNRQLEGRCGENLVLWSVVVDGGWAQEVHAL